MAIERSAGYQIFFKKYSDRVISRLAKIKSRTDMKPFPKVFWTLGVYFKLSKKESWQLLKLLQRKGKIKIAGQRGVRIMR